MADERKEAGVGNQSQQRVAAQQDTSGLNLRIASEGGKTKSVALRNPAPNSSPSSMPAGICMVVSRRDPA